MRALVLIDIQNDFLPGGSLAVPRGDQVTAVANRLMSRFDRVVATQDWHPRDHLSFASQHPGKKLFDVIDLEGLEQVLWPDHCVQETRGAEFPASLEAGDITRVTRKGTDRRIDSYSGFFDNGHRKSTGLGDYLKGEGVSEIFMMGLATDYCVKFTVLDALALGFTSRVVTDGCRGIDLAPGDVGRALERMRQAGADLVTSDSIPG